MSLLKFHFYGKLSHLKDDMIPKLSLWKPGYFSCYLSRVCYKGKCKKSGMCMAILTASVCIKIKRKPNSYMCLNPYHHRKKRPSMFSAAVCFIEEKNRIFLLGIYILKTNISTCVLCCPALHIVVYALLNICELFSFQSKSSSCFLMKY